MIRKRIKTYLFVLFILVMAFVTACNSKVEENIEYEISKEDMLAEYDVVWNILEENYPYFEMLKKRGVSVNSTKKVFRTFVEKAESFDEYYYIMAQMLNNELKLEGHLCLIDYNTFQKLNDTYESPKSSSLKNKKVYKYIQEPFFDKKVEQRYEMISEKINQTVMNDITENNFLKIIEKKEDKTLIIDYDSFFVVNYKDNTEKIRQALQEFPYEKILIDIRGNYGGGLFVWFDFVELLIDGMARDCKIVLAASLIFFLPIIVTTITNTWGGNLRQEL